MNEVRHSDTAQSVKSKILQNATKPSIKSLVQDDIGCVGKFPLKEFYQAGCEAVTGVEWVKYTSLK